MRSRHRDNANGRTRTATQKSRWLFATPEHPSTYALLLFGRVGSLKLSPARALVAGQALSRARMRLCATSQLAQVVHPNLARGGVDVFIHSWNPDESQFLDGLYAGALRASQHEQVTELPPAASQALSIGRAAKLARRYESSRNHSYSFCVVLRLDAAPLEPLHLHDLCTSGRIYFSTSCCAGAALTRLHAERVRRRCGHGVSETEGGPLKRFIEPCRIDHFFRREPLRHASVETGYHVKDWWFAASLTTALSWSRIARRWSWYVNRARVLRISRSGSKAGLYLTAHQIWPIHVHDALNESRSIAFRDWFVALGRFVLRPALMISPGVIDQGDGACNDQAFAPDASITPTSSAPLVPRADLAAAGHFAGRFAPMMMPPSPHATAVGSIRRRTCPCSCSC